MRLQNLIAGAAASLLFVALGAIASIASHLSGPADCAQCGVVVAVSLIEPKKSVAVRYRTEVRMSDGSVATLTSSTPPEWKAGDRVRLQNGRRAG